MSDPCYGKQFYKLIEQSNKILFSWSDPHYGKQFYKLMEQFNKILFSWSDPYYWKQFYKLIDSQMKYYSVSQTLTIGNSFINSLTVQ